jgi:endonuclease/exonuclease/phosphatase family metal-dependent hydrolase
MARRPPLTDRNVRALLDAFLRLPRRVQLVLVALVAVGVIWYLIARRKEQDGSSPPVSVPPGTGEAGSYLFCFWNVENLFDDSDDRRNRIDDDYDNAFAVDTGLRKLKYDRISDAFMRMNGGAGPDVIACAEVESTRAAELLKEALNARIADPGRRYTAVAMKDLNAGRHIAPCVISRVPVVPGATRMHGGNLRILETRLTANGHDLTVVAAHWTSQLRQSDGGHGEAGREKYARIIHQVVAGVTRQNPTADVLVCGDFNDTPESAEVVGVLQAVGDRGKVTASADQPFLLALMAGKPADRYGTLWYGGKPLIYDHICVSAGMLDRAGWGCEPDSVTTVTEGLIRSGATRRQPWRFGDPDQAVKPADRGYADHFPVAVRLTVQAAAAP